MPEDRDARKRIDLLYKYLGLKAEACERCKGTGVVDGKECWHCVGVGLEVYEDALGHCQLTPPCCHYREED